MKQTAAEWLVDMLIDNKYLLKDAEHLFNQAKEMEKEQMKDMFDNGVERGYDCYYSNEWAEEPTSPNFEQYYNETFKSE